MREADKKERTGKRKSRPRKVLRTKRRTKRSHGLCGRVIQERESGERETKPQDWRGLG